MEAIKLINNCLADPVHMNCKKFLITLERGSNGKCTQAPKHRDIEEIANQSGQDISAGAHFRFIAFYDITADATTYFVQRN